MPIAKRLLAAIEMAYTLNSSAFPCEAEDIFQAQKSAESWLKFWDVGEVQQSWDEASEFFETDVTTIDAKHNYNELRHPVRFIKERKLESSECKKGSDGDYLDVVFISQFACKASAIETVELVRE